MNADRVVLAQATATAWASVSIPLPDIDALRAKPGPPIVKAIGPKTLRFADEQTVAGMSAILQAIHAWGWQQESFADWGVLSAPRFLGRMITAFNSSRTMHDPSFSISPHIIPNFCLHSVSGAVSVALGIHGPNFGIGGGPDAVPEGIVAALSVLAEKRVPGVWLILSEFDHVGQHRVIGGHRIAVARVGVGPGGTPAFVAVRQRFGKQLQSIHEDDGDRAVHFSNHV